MLHDDGLGSVTMTCDYCGCDCTRDEGALVVEGETICEACMWDSAEQQKSEAEDRRLDNPRHKQA